MVSLTVTISYVPVFCIYNKHISWIYQANLAQCCPISTVQPLSTQCGPTSLLNSPIWSFNFLDLRAQPPQLDGLWHHCWTTVSLFEPTFPYGSLSSPLPKTHSHYFHSHHVFLNRGGIWNKENETWHFLSTKDTPPTRVETYGLRLVKYLECGAKYVKMYKKFNSSSAV